MSRERLPRPARSDLNNTRERSQGLALQVNTLATRTDLTRPLPITPGGPNVSTRLRAMDTSKTMGLEYLMNNSKDSSITEPERDYSVGMAE